MEIGTTLITYETKRSPDVLETSMEGKTPPTKLTSTIGMLTVPANTRITEHYVLQADLTAEVKIENGKYVVLDYQVDEYGIGDSRAEAQQNLLDSLVDYLESLEKREHRLADRELHKLQLLRNMLARS